MRSKLPWIDFYFFSLSFKGKVFNNFYKAFFEHGWHRLLNIYLKIWAKRDKRVKHILWIQGIVWWGGGLFRKKFLPDKSQWAEYCWLTKWELSHNTGHLSICIRTVCMQSLALTRVFGNLRDSNSGNGKAGKSGVAITLSVLQIYNLFRVLILLCGCETWNLIHMEEWIQGF